MEGLAGRGAVRENKVFEKCTWGKGAWEEDEPNQLDRQTL
jgi:hypothetical protein